MGMKLIVDSASDIGMQEAKEMGIEMLPMAIMFGDEEYYDGVDMLPTQFYQKLETSDVLPKTSQINAYRFEEAFEKCTANGDEVIVITLSSKLSGMYASAVSAAEKFNGKVYVVDSLNAAIGERLLCNYALQLMEKGTLSAEEIVEELNAKKMKIKVIALLSGLEYLKKGGRISSAVAFAGELLSLKPVIAIVEGEVKLAGKAMGERKGTILLNTLIGKTTGIDFAMPYGVVYSGVEKTSLKNYLKNSKALWEGALGEIPEYAIGATIGTHIGPGTVGVSFFEK